MPQIDFGRAFAEKNAPTKSSPDDIDNPSRPVAVDSSDIDGRKPLSIWRTAHFQTADWANILFVAVAIAGGLFSAFYFYNGAEVLRTVVNLPKEMLYQRPPDPMNDVAVAGATDPFIPRASAVDGLRNSNQGDARNNSTPALFNPSSPANPSITGAGAQPGLASFNPGSPSTPSENPSAGGPVPSVPGTENLGRAINATASLQRAARLLNGPHTVVVVKSHVARAVHRTVALAEKAGAGAEKGLAAIANMQNHGAIGSNTSRLAHSAQANAPGSSQDYRAALTNIGRNSVVNSSRSLGGRDSMSGGIERSAGLIGFGRNNGSSGLGDRIGRSGGMGEGIGGMGRGRGGRGERR